MLFSVTVWLVGRMEGEASVFVVGGGKGKEKGERRRGRRGEEGGRRGRRREEGEREGEKKREGSRKGEVWK